MEFEFIRAILATLPDLKDWPELAAVFERAGRSPRPDWELPMRAAEAVGGGLEVAKLGAAAIACLQISIILVDDILDNDPRGEYHHIGQGPAANMAMAFQALSFRLLESPEISPEIGATSKTILARIALATAIGQHLDVQNLRSETDYWSVVRAKSTPFYGGALQLGANLSGANYKQSQLLYDLGLLIGELIQIEDDLDDALQSPAGPDWMEGRNNLLILYALTADHSQKQKFISLLPQVNELAVLQEAQRILISSGSLSYCAYLLMRRYKLAQQLLERAELPNPSPLTNILNDYADTIISRLHTWGVDITRSQLLELKL